VVPVRRTEGLNEEIWMISTLKILHRQAINSFAISKVWTRNKSVG
jgi:hypothetical protein